MAGIENLRSLGDVPAEERKAIQSAGGVASGKARRKARNMREAAQILLAAALVDDPETEQALATLGLEADQQGAMLLAALRKSQTGDIEAARFVRDTSGQAPAQMVELGGMDGKPLQGVNLAELSNEELQKLLQQHTETDDNNT